jgi:AcrR family transcriptional regulator
MRHNAAMSVAPAAPRTARERVHAEIASEILATARQHLTRDGAAALSLRAIARDLGMVSSAVYRYVPNRDALLTMLIVDAYDTLGSHVERAEAAHDRGDYLGRFLACCTGVREWALANPHEYALIYGSPVPGYQAPADTIAPAARVPIVLLSILVDETANGHTRSMASVNHAVHPSVAPLREFVRHFSGGHVPDDLLMRGLASWATLLGSVSLELFGHLHNVIAEGPGERAAFFDHQMRGVAIGLGLAGG